MIENVVLDTEVFVLLIIGSIDQEYIGKFIKTKGYSKQEYVALLEKVKLFPKIVITPHVLAEFSHHTIEQSSFRDDYKKLLKEILLKMEQSNLQEKQSKMTEIFVNEKIFYLGVADVSLMEICDEKSVVITSDGRLADKLRDAGKNAIKFIPTVGFADY